MKLKTIKIYHEDWINSIGFTVEDLTTSSSLISSQHGGTGGRLSEVKVLYMLRISFSPG